MGARAEGSLLSRHPFPFGLAASAIVHIVVILGVRFDSTSPETVGVEVANRRLPAPVAAMQAVDLTIVAEAAPEFLPTTVRTGQAEIQPPPPVASPGRVADAPPDRMDPRNTVEKDAEGSADHRLWTRVDLPANASRDALDDTRAYVAGEVKAFHDSIAATRAAERGVTDWTRKTGRGGLWGASSGALQLGKLTLEYCRGSYSQLDCGIGVPPGKLKEYQSRVKAFAEIAAQQRRLALDAAVRGRINAMRRNAAVLRDSSRRAGGGARNPN